MKTTLRSTSTLRPSGTRSRPLPQLCSWISPMRCGESVEVTFESGLGYCRAHARSVKANRKWLRVFFENWQLAKQRERDA